MSASASNEKDTKPTFVEDDEAETNLPFDNGGVPFYIALVWAGFIVVYVIVMAKMALPDLRAWMGQ